MGRFKLTFIVIIVGLTYAPSIFAQKKSFPNWIKGTWHNSYESNTNNFEFWTFDNDNIFVGKGLMGFKSNRENLIIKYRGYRMTTTSTDSLFRVKFQKDSKTVIYEFMLHKVDYSVKPVLTYGMTTNELRKISHSTSMNLVLTK